MFLHDLLLGLFAAFILVAPVTAVTCIGVKPKDVEIVLITAAVLIVVYTIFNWLFFWWDQPIFGTSHIAINHEFWRVWWAIVVTAVIIGIAAAYSGTESSSDEGMPTIGSGIMLLIVLCLMGYGIAESGIWSESNAKTLAHEVKVTMEPASSYPDTNPSHIRQVSEEAANYYANQVMGSNPKLSTDWRVEGGILQSINNHLYYIYPLHPTGYSNSTKLPNSEDPGYVVVDAENPGNRWLRTKDAYGNPIHMIYYQGGYHSHGLGRFLWAHGFREQAVDDITMEVNNQWQPYYTAALLKPTINFNHDVPGSALVLNPQTGQSTVYPIKNGYPQGLPEWVDRIYSANVVMNMLNWWGQYNFAPYNVFHETSNNRYKVVGEPTLVYSDSGHPVWQVQLTSNSSDASVAYLALFDGRDDHVRMYQIPYLTQDNQAAETIEGVQANTKKLTAVNLTLYKIYGQLTWVASLVCDQGENKGEESGTSCAQQGMAMVPYNHLDGQSVAFSQSLQGALVQYAQTLTSEQSGSNVQENGLVKAISGVVSRLNQVDSGGNTVWYFMLTGDNEHIYSASMQASTTSVNIELPFVSIGSKVSFSYLNTGSQVRQVVNSSPFFIHGLKISSEG